MSMLAEPRRRQKWTLNPRGKMWSEDSSKFGQKMLEKMGWSVGKGLGAKEQGTVEHIRVRIKNDTGGIGFEKNKNDQWTENHKEFDNILQNLQKEQLTETKKDFEEDDKILSGKSLEEKSKLSQKRVHYKKFTRGKDVNKYNAKDLANIFGKKDLKIKTNEEEKEEKEEKEVKENVCDPIGSKDMTAGILTIKGGSINDYFKNKFPISSQNSDVQEKIKSRSKFYVKEEGEEVNSEDESERFRGFGFIKATESKSKSKKMNNLNYVFDNPCLDLNILDSPVNPNKSKNTEVVTPRKRKSEFIYDNEGLNLAYSDIPTPKKRKNKEVESNGSNSDSDKITKPKIVIKSEVILNRPINLNPFIVKKEKDSEYSSGEFENLGKNSNSLDNIKIENNIEFTSNSNKSFDKNSNFPDSSVKIETNGDNDSETAVSANKNTEFLNNTISIIKKEKDYEILSGKKKSKKSKRDKNCDVSLNVHENPGHGLEISQNKQTPKKIKKEKDVPTVNGYENPGLDLEFPDKPTPKKIKKGKDVLAVNGYENSGLDLEYPNEPTPKKIKKGKDVPTVNGYENPGLDLEFPDKPTPKKIKKRKDVLAVNGYENSGLDLEYPNEPTPKKIKKGKDVPTVNGYENSGLDLEYPDKPTPKKIKKDVPTVNGYENPGLDLEFPDKPTPKKIKKGKDVPTVNGYENSGLDLEYPDKPTPKKIKKDVPTVNGYENPGLDLEFPDKPTPKKIKKEKESKISTRIYENSGLSLEFPDKVTPKKKKNKKNYSLAVGFINPALEITNFNGTVPHVDFEVSRTKHGIENSALDLEENSSKRKVSFSNEVDCNTDVIKKKKKKKKLDKYEVENKLKKKSKELNYLLTDVTYVNEALNVGSNEEEIDNELNERKSKKLKRKKERRISLLETIVEDPEEENVNRTQEQLVKKNRNFNLEISSEISPGSSLHKKKKSNHNNGQAKLEEENIVVDIPKEDGNKKKKKKKNSLEEDIQEYTESVESMEVIKKKKKNHKNRLKEIEIEIFQESIENTITEKKNKKKSQAESLDCGSKMTENSNNCHEELLTIEEMLNQKPSKVKNYASKNQSRRSWQKNKELIKRAVNGPSLMFTGSNLHEIPGYGNKWRKDEI